jgi:quercetin dioxygenase-like cupin family protein
MEVMQLVRDFQAGGFHDLREIRVAKHIVPQHYAPTDRVFVILDGVLEIICNGGVCKAGVGTYVYIPAGRFHSHGADQSGCRYLLATRSW